MYKLKNLKKISKQYKTELKDILTGYNIINIDSDKLILRNEDNDIFNITYSNNVVILRNESKYLIRDIKLLLKNEENKSTKILETKIEKRKNGIIVEYITKIYDYLTPFDEKKQVISLVSQRYVLKNKDYNIDSLINSPNFEEIKKQSSMNIKFESNILNYNSFKQKVKVFINDKVHTINLYDKIKGNNRLNRIYDLYNGTISQDNFYDIIKINSGILSEDCFDYKTKYNITSTENKLIGKSKLKKTKSELKLANKLIIDYIGYIEPVNMYNRDSLMRAIKYKTNKLEKAQQIVEKIFGMRYQDFLLLDYNEQKNLIESKNKIKQYRFFK